MHDNLNGGRRCYALGSHVVGDNTTDTFKKRLDKVMESEARWGQGYNSSIV